MRLKVVSPLVLIFWAGFVSSISFMEAWLKFQAPGITLSLGLGIGKLVFTALNAVEWVLLVCYLILMSISFKSLKFLLTTHLLQGIVLILLLQSFWLLPALVERADLIISGNQPEESYTHLFYIGLEVIKVILLITLSVKQILGRLK